MIGCQSYRHRWQASSYSFCVEHKVFERHQTCGGQLARDEAGASNIDVG